MRIRHLFLLGLLAIVLALSAAAHATAVPVNSSCRVILQSYPGSTNGIYTVCPESGICRNVYCDMVNGGWASIFTMDGNLTLNTSSRMCILSNYNDDMDSSMLWTDLSAKVSYDNSDETGNQNWMTWHRDGTEESSPAYLPDRPAGVGTSARPVPLPAANKTIWFDWENSRIAWDGTTVPFSSVGLDSIGFGYYGYNNPNPYFISDGVTMIHVGQRGGGNAVVLVFNFYGNTVANESATVLAPPNGWWGTEQDAFLDVLYTVNGRVMYYENYIGGTPGNGTFVLGGYLPAPGGLHDTSTVYGWAYPSQPGLDFFARVDDNGSLWFGDWGHDNGGYFNCGNDQYFGVAQTNIILAYNGSTVQAPVQEDHDDAPKPYLSLDLESSCEGNVVTVEDDDDEAHVVVKDAQGNILAAGDTRNGEFSFPGCDLEDLTLKGTMSGYKATVLENQNTISCSECANENVTPGCVKNDDCPLEQQCVSGVCATVACECGAIANHQCSRYQCCLDSQCGAGEACTDHVCTQVERPSYECYSDAQCEGTEYCDVAAGAAGGSCKSVPAGPCGEVRNHAFAAYGYECGTEPGCPSCPNGETCSNHACIPVSDLSCPTTGLVGDSKTCEVKEKGDVCSGCDYTITDPSGKKSSGKTDENGNFNLPLGMEGTYKVDLLKDGAVVKTIEVKSMPGAEPEKQPEKPAAGGMDIAPVIIGAVALLALAAGAAYLIGRGGKKK